MTPTLQAVRHADGASYVARAMTLAADADLEQARTLWRRLPAVVR